MTEPSCLAPRQLHLTSTMDLTWEQRELHGKREHACEGSDGEPLALRKEKEGGGGDMVSLVARG